MATKSSKPKAKTAVSTAKSSGGLSAKITNPKNRLWLIIAVFVLIGGAFMVYKSFAATPSDQSTTTVLYNINNNRLNTFAGQKVPAEQKDGNNVYALKKNASAYTTGSLPITGASTVCFMIKGSGQLLKVTFPSIGQTNGTATYITASGGQYKEYCLSSTYTGNTSPRYASVVNISDLPGFVYVEYIKNKTAISGTQPTTIK